MENRGCLFAFLGWLVGAEPEERHPPLRRSKTSTPMDEGDVHSGPGGYEGMGYAGGYAADYYSSDDDDDNYDEGSER